MKRIALIGNMNNNFFSVARYLRDYGFDARLFLLKEEAIDIPHFHPSCDTFSDDYKEFVETVEISKRPSIFWRFPKEDIKAILGDFDFVIGTSAVPAYASKADIQMDLFVPYGSDVYDLPFFKTRGGIRKSIKAFYLSYHQRVGIRKSKYLWMDVTNPSKEKLFAKLGFQGVRIKMNFPFIYLPEYEFGDNANFPADRFHNYGILYNKKHEHDFVVFHHCRQSWFTLAKDDFEYKGNDKIVLAAKKLILTHKNIRPLFVLVEYGGDIGHTKKLIQELNLEDYFLWLPKMPRKELMLCLHLADLGIGELGHSWFSYSVAFEFLAAGVPLVHRRDDHFYDGKNLYPMYYASNQDDLYEVFFGFLEHPEKYKEIGRLGKKWIEEWGINKPLLKLIEIITES